MSNSSIDSKIQVLEARLKAENESRDRDIDLHQGTFAVPRPGSGRKPRNLLSLKPDGTPTRSRKQLDLPMAGIIPHTITEPPDSKLEEIMKMSGMLNVNGAVYKTDFVDLEQIGELGNGTCGHVVKMLHKPSTNVIAVKQMRRSGNTEENKRIIMDLDVVLKSHDCPYIVQCLGCFISAADVWICMELMATCFDKLLKRLKKPIPEHILGKVTVATVNALSYLKEQHGVIHRDVKPSNILLDERGRIKLCDFGISGRLVDSKARTRSAGCAAYMAPERIDPPDPNYPDYDIRADVWSLGITLVELATGSFPYLGCSTDFEVLARVINEDPPSLPIQGSFSKDFQDFVKLCLTKNPQDRPKYAKLLKHPFVKHYDNALVNVDVWFSQALQQADMIGKRRYTPPPPSPNSRRHFAFHSRNSSESRITPDPNRPQLESRINNSEIPVPLSNGNLNYNNLELRTTNGPLRHFMQNDFNSDSQPAVQNGSNDPKIISSNLPPINRTNKLNSATIYQDTRIPVPEIHQDRFAKGYERQVSPYMQRRPLPESDQSDGFWQVPQGSPLANRKRLQVFPDRYNLQDSNRPLSGNTSPILMNRLYHQRHQTQSHSPPITYPITNQQQFMAQDLQFKSAPHSHIPVHIPAAPTTNEKEQAGLWGSVAGAMKRRFASCIKVQLGGHSRSAQNNQDDGGGVNVTHSSPRYSAQSQQPSGIIGSLDRRRHQSPDPPPRLNRSAVGSSSPLAMRRNFLDMNSGSGSPNFARRYPTAPQPPPRRLSESSSTPGSPQHLRTRLHYTPEPLRRHYPPPELS